MKMKKIVAMLLTVATAASMVACGSKEAAAPAQDAAPAADAATAEAPAVDYGTGEITIWVAEEVVNFTQAQCDAFFAANPDMAGYTVNIQPTGEGDAAGNMITDVEGGADIYGFAQDQLSRLVAAGALTPITGDYESFVTSQNDAGSVAAAQVGGKTYAFPLTSDNGYFLYYDKSVVTDPSSLDKILADCEAAGKKFYMEINSGWYQTAFFFGTGCEMTYETDDAGNFVSSNMTYASDNGVKALKAMIALNQSPAFVNGSSVGNADGATLGAIVDGTWDSSAAKDVFGDNYACAKLPTFNADGTDVQFSGFGGFKLLGVKPQTEQGKMLVCINLAQFLTSADVQLARYNEVGWGPSNTTAQSDSAVQSDEALSALAQQLAFTIPQGQYPGDYWADATSLGDSVIAHEMDKMSDEELLKVLQDFEAKEATYVQ
ncbi:MAG: extracellular solute-binding protein [Pseudobutyrivibrio sp.]|nr:extracellular solute-binding protein [Pseudobutyrivibrio sp.]